MSQFRCKFKYTKWISETVGKSKNHRVKDELRSDISKKWDVILPQLKLESDV